ncbi:beta-phosphoglucomutase [Flavobacteriaceae bacterium]|nr:beta-phosphoglucomutase [Flavobacteriaceae bacterium]
MKAFIFDLDGVIVDTAKYHYLAWKRIGEKVGFSLTHDQNESLKGVSRKESLERILDWANVRLSEKEKEALLIEKNKDYLQQIEEMGQEEILPGVLDLLHFAQKNNIPVSLGSASKNATPILKKLAIDHLFDAIVDGNNVTASKPNPEVFLKGAELLKQEPKNCIVFEDAAAGIQAAKAAGMISIGMGGTEEVKTADHCFTSMTAITKEFITTL